MLRHFINKSSQPEEGFGVTFLGSHVLFPPHSRSGEMSSCLFAPALGPPVNCVIQSRGCERRETEKVRENCTAVQFVQNHYMFITYLTERYRRVPRLAQPAAPPYSSTYRTMHLHSKEKIRQPLESHKCSLVDVG